MLKNHRTTTTARAIKRRAFSLLELMLVVAIIGILMGVVAYNLAGATTKTKVRASKISMETIKGALSAYNAEQSSYPPTLLPLVSGKFLADDKALKDGWQRDFFYSPQGLNEKPFQLISLGEDGQPGTADDIDIWTMNATK